VAIDSPAVEIVPDFGPGENTDAPPSMEAGSCFRLSVGAVSLHDIVRGLPVLAAAR